MQANFDSRKKKNLKINGGIFRGSEEAKFHIIFALCIFFLFAIMAIALT